MSVPLNFLLPAWAKCIHYTAVPVVLKNHMLVMKEYSIEGGTILVLNYSHFSQSNNPDITLRKLSIAVNLTTALPDQNVNNLRVIRNIFTRTAALGQSRIVPEVLDFNIILEHML